MWALIRLELPLSVFAVIDLLCWSFVPLSSTITAAKCWESIQEGERKYTILGSCPLASHQVQLEKLLRWNIAVRNFHILINLVKVRLLLFFWFYLHVPSKAQCTLVHEHKDHQTAILPSTSTWQALHFTCLCGPCWNLRKDCLRTDFIL